MTNTEAAILERVIQSGQRKLSPEVAKELLRFDFSESDHTRMAELSEKAQQGSLSELERDELDGYINVSHFIALIQSKARISGYGGHGKESGQGGRH
jgi:hypothetical protein